MRLPAVVAIMVAAALAGCGFTASPPPGGTPAIDAAADAPSDTADAPVTIDTAMIDAPMVIIDAPPLPHDCGASYVTVAGSGTASKYRKVNTLTTWPTAKAMCEQDTAYLVIPDTLTEGMAISLFVDPSNSSPYYWAGIEDPNNDNVWTTVLGATFANPPFQGGQPSNGATEIYILVGSNGRFYDWLSDGTQEYACECAP